MYTRDAGSKYCPEPHPEQYSSSTYRGVCRVLVNQAQTVRVSAGPGNISVPEHTQTVQEASGRCGARYKGGIRNRTECGAGISYLA